MRGSTDVALVCMPYYKAEVPPIALGLLKSLLRQRDVAVDLHHFNLWFAEIDYPSYREINDEVFFHGEWIFSHALWGTTPPTDIAEAAAILKHSQARFCPEFQLGVDSVEPVPLPGIKRQTWVEYAKKVLAAVERVEPFLQRCLDEIDWSTYRVVGFTSTFQQNVASLALAKRLKERFPQLYIMFGGANCDGVMGEAMFRAFPFIDGVCVAEGDQVFPDFVDELLRDAPPRRRDGLLDRRLVDRPRLRVFDSGSGVGRPPFTKLDDLPYPDYDDYFAQYNATSFREHPNLVYFETSRGCWYGQKQHCTFCGVNGGAIDFREKSPDRAIDEIAWIHGRYGGGADILAATDNIMPANYPRTMLPKLEALDLDTHLFYETKSNLRKPQVQQYARAGVKHIQPGIESLNSRVLKLMKKGVTALQNIQTLKWCRQYNVRARWNVLFGFPGESAEDYTDHPTLFAKLHHLHAPLGCSPIRIDRFSPYQERPESYGITNMRPHPGYQEVYRGLDEADIADIAYCFVADYPSKPGVAAYADMLHETVTRWQVRADEAALFYVCGEERLVIGDFRRPGSPTIHPLVGAERLIYETCDRIQPRRKLVERLAESGFAEAQLDPILTRLVELDLLLAEGDRYLSLAFEFDGAQRSGDAYFPPTSCWPWLGDMLGIADAP